MQKESLKADWNLISKITTAKHPNEILVEISPATAEVLVEKYNDFNRAMDHRNITLLAEYMRVNSSNGRFVPDWTLYTSPIVFATDGNMIDGQHRLKAQAKAGVVCKYKFSIGLDREVFKIVGLETPRKLQDRFHAKGIKKFHGQYASAVMRILAYKFWRLSDVAHVNNKVRHDEAVDFGLSCKPRLYPMLSYYMSKGKKINSRHMINPLLFAVLHYITDAQAEEFLEGFYNLRKDSIQDKVVKHLKRRKKENDKVGINYQLPVLIKAWNSFVDGVTVRNIGFSDGEGFPEIRKQA